jgi:hypothetical protein
MSDHPVALPTVHIEPIVAAPEEVLRHAMAVGLPVGSPVACYRIGPLDDLDRRLAGAVWEVFGCEVDVTAEPPTYPFLWLQWRGTPHMQLQIWRWRIYPAQPPAFAEIRWSPGQEPYVNLAHLSLDPTRRRPQQDVLGRYVNATQRIYRRGRPVNSGTWRSREEFLQDMEPLVRECWQSVPPTRPTARRIEAMLAWAVTAHTIGHQCQHWLGVDWDTFIERVRAS